MTSEEITSLRALQLLSMSALAQILRVDVNLVVDWESGVRFPTKKHSEALRLLGVRRNLP